MTDAEPEVEHVLRRSRRVLLALYAILATCLVGVFGSIELWPALAWQHQCSNLFMGLGISLLFAIVAAERRTISWAVVAAKPADIGILMSLFTPALNGASEGRNREVEAAITRLLPEATAEDIRGVTTKQARNLYRRLQPGPTVSERGLALAILEMLERTLDTRALPYLEVAARSDTAWLWTTRPDERMRRCLERLRAERAKELNESRLLKPAEPDADAQSLLRPAGAHAAKDDALLLQAAGPSCADADG